MKPPESTAPPPGGAGRAACVTALCLGTVSIQFDGAVNVAFPDLVRAFALPIPDIQWIVIAYTLTHAALMLVFGRAGDIVGHRTIFLAGAATSMLAFTLCALATDYGWLLAFRVLQGIGAALTLSCGPALITSLYPEDRRAQILSVFTLVIGIGGALGPILGGLLVERFGWAAVFAFRAPIALAALTLGWVLPKGRAGANGGGFDAPGALVLVLAVAALLLAANRLQGDGQVLASTVLALVSLALGVIFWRRESRVPNPIIDVGVFRNPDFALLNVAHMLLNLAGFAIFLLVPFYLSAFTQLSAPLAGLILSASPVGMILGAPVAARLVTKLSAEQLATLGATSSVAGLSMIALLSGQFGPAVIVAAALLQGFGLGLFQVAYFDIATLTIPKESRGVAGSLVLMTRTVGIVMGASLLMLAFQSMSGHADQSSAGAELLRGFEGAFGLAAMLSLSLLLCALVRGWGWRKPQ
ncbi:MAG: MFS transporter [Xanthobacteraceae bacterium]